MNLSHRLLSSALLAGAVFSITALPLTTLGPKPVTIQLEGRPVFVGQLRELAAPYLALATGVSLGVGAISLAVSSWRHAAHKLERSEAEISALKQQVSEKDALIERLRFSDTKLYAHGLGQFLQAEETIALRSVSAPVSAPASISETISEPELPSKPPAVPYTIPHFDPPITTPSRFSTAGLEFFLNDEMTEPAPSQPAQPIAAKRVQPSTYSTLTEAPLTEPAKIQAMSALPAAQSFMGFVRSDAREEGTVARSQLRHSPQLDELLGNLKQVMTQIEQLHASQSSRRNG